jgi:hypothetical protein
MIKENNGKFMVEVDGTYLNELANNEWVYCKFDTREEAQKALDEYKQFKAWAAE